MVTIFIFLFLFGLGVGSFLNVIILRGERGEKLTGRSHCDSCGTALSLAELIPLASFVRQKGRCLHCGAVLSLQYPLVELGTAGIYVLAGWIFFQGDLLYSIDLVQFLSFAGALIAIAAGIVIFVEDMRAEIIPDAATITLLLVGIGVTAFRVLGAASYGDVKLILVLFDVGAAVVASLSLGAIWFFSRGRAMGFGDVKLIGATSLILGFPQSLAAFLISFWLGGIVGIILLVFGKKNLKSHIPFGPFIIAGTVLVFFFGDAMLRSIGVVL